MPPSQSRTKAVAWSAVPVVIVVTWWQRHDRQTPSSEGPRAQRRRPWLWKRNSQWKPDGGCFVAAAYPCVSSYPSSNSLHLSAAAQKQSLRELDAKKRWRRKRGCNWGSCVVVECGGESGTCMRRVWCVQRKTQGPKVERGMQVTSRWLTR
ncbi:hypothetical protein CC85DRAFT_38868 [Cutaneotrichosporon oleaginosum]|uniref:Uncharacterized protein n=1 Tax=Cutaneotrichosporon oleaginosum TaxID=879819 RepID=A0A0J0XB88_9TREE|nr:uncharacterized protein CC85DRAFT_38868 [Cutaneotrichosporon oleaginosum]KLT38310.1 hypothetical protein CC85DRAFT_38868 [Cutaneotrichosporon oleaginosum]TXT07963.1 hypothetical protein COLE_04887 [Cutaneotrichosporon oleaginosum]